MNKPGKNLMSFDQYLATLSAKEQAVLQRIRKTIRSLVPDAVEGISYGMQAFLIKGKPFAALAATAHHCAYYPMSGSVVITLAKELEGYDTSKGTVRFCADKPLPTTLVRKLVNARLAEIEGQSSSKGSSTIPSTGVTNRKPVVKPYLART